MRLLKLAALAAALSAASAASAHHSSAMFDLANETVMSGSVKQLQITNPHSWLMVVVPGVAGAEDTWSLEMGPVSSITRMGVSRATFKPGDAVVVTVNVLRDGRRAGRLVRVTRPTGELLYGQR